MVPQNCQIARVQPDLCVIREQTSEIRQSWSVAERKLRRQRGVEKCAQLYSLLFAHSVPGRQTVCEEAEMAHSA